MKEEMNLEREYDRNLQRVTIKIHDKDGKSVFLDPENLKHTSFLEYYLNTFSEESLLFLLDESCKS